MKSGIVALAMLTGWPLSEILELDEGDFVEYYEAAIEQRNIK